MATAPGASTRTKGTASPTRFFYREVEAELEFDIDPKTDRATAVTLSQDGKRLRFLPKPSRSAIPLTQAQLDRLAGDYPSPSGFTITITRREDALLAQLTGQPAVRVYAASSMRFFYREVEAELQFELDPKAEHATAVTLFQNGKQFRCPRKP